MSTLAEIEEALTKLAPEELKQLEVILERVQQRRETDLELESLERSNGFECFPQRSGAPATIDFVRKLCQDEGI